MDIYGYCGHMDIVDTWILWTHGYCGDMGIVDSSNLMTV